MPTDAKNKRYVIHYDIHNNTRITNINEKLTHINEKCNFQRFNTVIRRLNLAIITFLLEQSLAPPRSQAAARRCAVLAEFGI